MGYSRQNPFNTSHKERRYTFYDTKVGDVYYGGTAEINQFNQDSVVEMVLGENISKKDSDGFNFYMTHSDIMKISGLELKAGDVIKFDGIHVYRNNLRIDDYNKTKQQPVLMPGWNTFRTTKKLQKSRLNTKDITCKEVA